MTGLVDLLLTRLAPLITETLTSALLSDGEIAGATTDLATGRTVEARLNLRERNQLRRELQSVGEHAVERMEPYLRAADARSLEDTQAAVREAITTLERGLPAMDLALEANMQPTVLEGMVRAVRPDAASEAGLSESSVLVYDLLITEACASVTQLVSELTDYPARVLTRLLQRSAALEERLLVALDALPKRSEADVNNDFTTRYRRAVAEKLDWMSLIGLRGAPRAARRYALSIAYVSPVGVADPDGASPDADEWAHLRQRKDETRIEHLVARHPRLVVGGVAGSGKTTVLQWLAVRAVTETFTGPLAAIKQDIPLFVRLRDYADRELPSVEEVVDRIAGSAASLRPATWVVEQLRAGRVLLLVDGLDELPDARRPEVAEWIDDVLLQYPETRVVASSRPAALDGWELSKSSVEVQLAPMNLPDIELFVDHWHEAALQGEGDDAAADLRLTAAELKRTLRAQSAVRRLARNPLMCAVVCALNFGSDSMLPRGRIELYETALELLLDERDRKRRLTTIDYGLTHRQKSLLLQELAWWMARNDYAVVALQDAEARLAPYVERLGLEGDPSTASILRYLIERTGVVREPAVGQVDFIHKTFMEYLAALRAISGRDLGLLARSAPDVALREVVVLAAGAAPPADRDELLRQLLRRVTDDDPSRVPLILLAAQSVDLAPDVDPELRTSVDRVLSTIIPPATPQQAEALAAAGDVAVPMLRWADSLSEEELANSIRALGRIGSVAALEELKAYGRDDRPPVLRELMHAWDAFDRELFARDVMASNPMAGLPLHLSASTSIACARWLQHLTSLDIARVEAGVDWATALPPKLEVLRIRDATGVRTFRGLPADSSLRVLELESAIDLADFRGLAEIPLERLSLSRTTKLQGIGGFTAARRSLRVLQLESARATDLSPLAHFPQLEELELRSTKVDSLVPLVHCKRLRALTLVAVDRSLSFKVVSELERLRELTVAYYGYPLSVEPDSLDLDRLTLQACPGISDLRSATPLGQVRDLRLIGMELLGLSGLARFAKGVTHLELQGSRIRDLTGIPPTVTHLTLDRTGVSSSAGIAELPNLTHLSLRLVPTFNVADLAASPTLQEVRCSSVGLAGTAELRSEHVRFSVVADSADERERWKNVGLGDLLSDVPLDASRTTDDLVLQL